ncbi:hypothetical protein FDA94_29230 [Herbidospora galbida]|uniref:Uncharacterized protein n=1 Tax=Herbidospora galbida TaxID=2575442 RepID=A0A4U3M8W9_9ACTN|nr:hypothetical protein [Herbidospora galbida]TKK84699.1 hypothetical protein FDA94_29230 [Herbidospora galbida]
MPWILNEDEAFQAHLSGLTVSHANGVIPVPVRFMYPEVEAPSMDYPMIVIEHVGAELATDRMHRGTVRVDAGPEGGVLPEEGARWGWYAPFPDPYDLDYSVRVLTRLRSHQIELAGALAKFDRLPQTSGFLEITSRDMVASLDVIGGPQFGRSVDDDGKRLFEILYTVRIASEFYPWDIEQLSFPDHVGGTIYNREKTRLLSDFEIDYT